MGSDPDEVSILLDQLFLSRLDAASLDELDVKRDACRRADAALGYAYRLLRALLETVEAEGEWRLYNLDRRLSRIAEDMADDIVASAARLDLGVASPGPGVDPYPVAELDVDGPFGGIDILGWAPDINTLVVDLSGSVRSLDDSALAVRAEQVRTTVGGVHARRQALRLATKRIEAEISKRYRSGEADVAAPLTPDEGEKGNDDAEH
jgi:hypothetical protein